MSLMDRMKAGFSTLFGTTPKTSQQQSLYHLRQSIKSSSSTRQTIPLPTYNSFLERVLRNSQTTADSSLPATTKTKSLSPSIRDAQSSSSPLQENKNQQSLVNSSQDLIPSWDKNGLSLIRKSSQNLSTNTSPIGEESSTSVNDTQ